VREFLHLQEQDLPQRLTRLAKAALVIVAAISLIVVVGRDLYARHHYGVGTAGYRAITHEAESLNTRELR